MNLTAYAFLFPILIVLLLSVVLINKLVKTDLVAIQFPEIDGLRGYLAFFVFLHHGYIWQVFLKTQKWEDPESNLYNQFGETSVIFFFIITAFLFTLKLLNNKNREINWTAYIKARFYRLFPMYFFSVVVIFILVAVLTQFKSQVSFLENLKSTLAWLFFSVVKNLDINGFEKTFIINSGIAWTLPYEWAFYFLLPLIALFFKIKTNFKALITFTIAAAIIMILNKSSLRHFTGFLGGIIVACLVHKGKLRGILNQKKYTLLAFILLAASVYFFNGGRKPIQIIIASVVFWMIASGNSFFGILSSNLSRKFGQLTYSLYLLHGIVLFILFRFIIGYENAKNLTETEFWLIITAAVFPLLFICQLTYKYIELPLMSIGKKQKLK